MAQIYKVEDEFDFYKALNETDDLSDENICMITHLPLTLNSVTLPCKHSFNYMPLYTEFCIHHNYRNIRCPYCRTEFDKFLPFIPLPNVKRVIGVNSPEKKCMPAPSCEYMFKNKGKVCSMNGMETESGIFFKTKKGSSFFKMDIYKCPKWKTQPLSLFKKNVKILFCLIML